VIDHNTERYAEPQNYDEVENDAGVAFYTTLAQRPAGPFWKSRVGPVV